jgi:inosose dehydratase
MSRSSRIAVAASTWGLEPEWDWVPERTGEEVIAAAAALGFDGFEPATRNGEGPALAAQLQAAGLACPSRYVALPLHDADGTVEAGLAGAAALRELGGTVLLAGPGSPETADPRGLERLAIELAGTGMIVAVHPEAGSSLASAEDTQAVLDGAPSVFACFETGHLWVEGCSDLAGLVARWGDRIRHVHLKDADGVLGAKVRTGEMLEMDANRAGLWRPPGEGGVPLVETIEALLAIGYDGWWVLEEDASADPVRSSREGLELVRRVLASAAP